MLLMQYLRLLFQLTGSFVICTMESIKYRNVIDAKLLVQNVTFPFKQQDWAIETARF